MVHEDVRRWLDRYVEAWRTHDPPSIGDLFSEDAEYRYHPREEPVRGREAIVAAWLAPDAIDSPGSWLAEHRPFAVEGRRAVAVGWSRYLEPDGSERRTYGNCFALEFDPDGHGRSSTEWYALRVRA